MRGFAALMGRETPHPTQMVRDFKKAVRFKEGTIFDLVEWMYTQASEQRSMLASNRFRRQG